MTKANEPAFARAAWDMKVEGEGWIGAPAQDGLTKREYFAAQAMKGLLSSVDLKDFDSLELVAASHRIANEMIAELNKQPA